MSLYDIKVLRNYLHNMLFYYYIQTLHTFMTYNGLFTFCTLLNSMLFAYFTLLLSELMLFDIYVPRLNLHTDRYHVKYIWTERDTHVESVAQLKLVILNHVNMAWTIYTLTCEHCMICQFDNYLYLCTYIAQCINVSIFGIFYLNKLCKLWVTMYCATAVTFFA